MPKCGPARQGQRSWTAGDQGNDDVMRNLECTRPLICMSRQRTAPGPSLVSSPASPPPPPCAGDPPAAGPSSSAAQTALASRARQGGRSPRAREAPVRAQGALLRCSRGSPAGEQGCRGGQRGPGLETGTGGLC